MAKEARKKALERRKGRPLRDAFDFKHLQAFLGLVNTSCPVANARIRISFILLACYGFRIGQFGLFTIGNLRELYYGSGTRMEAIKSRKREFIEMPKIRQVKQWLQFVQDDIDIILKSGPDDQLFYPCSREPQAFQNRQLNKILKLCVSLGSETACAQLHKVQYTSHSFRIGLVTRITEAHGIDTARRVANHSDIATTQHYLRNTFNKKQLFSVLRDIIQAPS